MRYEMMNYKVIPFGTSLYGGYGGTGSSSNRTGWYLAVLGHCRVSQGGRVGLTSQLVLVQCVQTYSWPSLVEE